jgi:hypothetical protein
VISTGKKVRFVVEEHELPCSYCGDVGWNLAIWIDVRWVSGANPPGAPAVVLCRECVDLAKVGALVGP